MLSTVERVSGLLYRVGRRHDDGSSSVVSLAGGPARIVAGELAASVADVLVARTHGRLRADPSLGRRAEIGPSPR